MAQKVILDVDTGTDDAVAIMFAALHPELELVAVTTVNGNVQLTSQSILAAASDAIVISGSVSGSANFLMGQNTTDFDFQTGASIGGNLNFRSGNGTNNFGTGGTSSVSVTVTGQAISLIGVTMHITQTATGPVEQFQTGS